jgi:hypothetical protein
MNQNFWDHLINAAGHLMDASAREREEREHERQRKPKRVKSTSEPAPASKGFDANDPSCCIAKRRVKVAR